MAVNKGEIGIYGILRRDGGDGILAKTDQIQDDTLKKTQEQLNQEAVNGAALAAAHIANTNNPHNVTKVQVGLDKVTNDEQVKRTEMGKPLGVATLDGLGKVPSSQLPAYVDDVVEYETVDSFPKYGESGKIYVETTTNLTYRWTGTQYIEISKSIGLGETESTAYPGNKGKQVADSLDSHIKDTTNPHNVTKEQLGLDKVDNTPDNEKRVKNADTVGDYPIGTSNKSWGTIPVVNISGFSEMGKHLEFHYDNDDRDFSTLLRCTGNYGNEVDLPSGTGTLVLTSDNVASATKLKTPVKIWGQDFDGSKDIEGPFRYQDITISNNNEIDCTYGSHNLLLNYRSSGNVNIAQGGGVTTVGPLRPSMQDNCTLNVHGSMKAVGYKLEDSTEYAEPVIDTEVETMLNDLGI